MRECEHGRVCNAYGDGLGCPAECGYYEPRIDRAALLELADILGSTGEMDCRGCRLEGAGCAECSSGVAHEAARRIRETLGVDDG